MAPKRRRSTGRQSKGPASREVAAEAADEGDVEMLSEKSRAEVLAERFQAARARGDVIALDGDRAPAAPTAAAAASASAGAPIEEDDDEVQVVRVLDLPAALEERYKAAQRAGNVVDLVAPAADEPAAAPPDEPSARAAEPQVKPEPGMLAAVAPASGRPAAGHRPSDAASTAAPAAPPAAPAVAPHELRRLLGPAMGTDAPTGLETVVQLLAERLRLCDLRRGAARLEDASSAAHPPPIVELLSDSAAAAAAGASAAELGALIQARVFATAALPAPLADIAAAIAYEQPPPAAAPPGAVPPAAAPPALRLRRLPFWIDQSLSRSTRVMMGVEVHFPFDAPLPSQTKVMVAVIRSLEQRQACLVESPTGTGKTVALLCAALAWQRRELEREGEAPRVYYGIRTHSQVKSVIAELQKTPYRPAMTFLASRERQCLNPTVGQGETPAGGGGGGKQPAAGAAAAGARAALNQRCRAAVRAVDKHRRVLYERGRLNDERPSRAADDCGCEHYRQMASSAYARKLCARARPQLGPAAAPALGARPAGVFDIEDLAAFGRDPDAAAAAARAADGADGAGDDDGDDGDGSDDGGGVGADADGVELPVLASLGVNQCAAVALRYNRAGETVVDAAPAGCGLEPGDRVRAVGVRGHEMAVTAATLALGAASLISLAAAGGGVVSVVATRGGAAPRSSPHLGCPYYSSLALAAGADLVFCPYKYLIDPSIRAALKLNVRGAAIILDEAHNIESECRDVGSADVELFKLMAVVEWARREVEAGVQQRRNARRERHVRPSLVSVAAGQCEPILSALVGALVHRRALFEGTAAAGTAARAGGGSQPSQGAPASGPLKSQAARERERRERFRVGADERALLHKWTPTTTARALEELLGRHAEAATLRAAVGALSEAMASSESRDDDGGGGGGPTFALLEVALSTLNALSLAADKPSQFVIATQVWHNGGSAFARRTPASPHLLPAHWGCDGSAPEWGLELCVWLMSPSVVFDQLAEQAHALILTSGTLSPIGAMEKELGEAFVSRVHPTIRAVQAEHVLGAEQLLARVVATSAAGCRLACTSEQLGKPEVGLELGITIANLARQTPRTAGVLVFVSSFATARRLRALWQDSGAHENHWSRALKLRWPGTTVWSELEATKGLVLIESHGKDASSADDVRAFRAAVDGGGGALCIAVYRGKLSEGISFNDDYARLVVCVGLPFPSVTDEQIRSKRAFNELPASRAAGLLSGHDWYRQQAFRALNQALGRCVRHRDDWGVLVLIDERFANASERTSLSLWLQRLLPPTPTPVPQIVQEARAHLSSAPAFIDARRRTEAAARAASRAALEAAGGARALVACGSQPAAGSQPPPALLLASSLPRPVVRGGGGALAVPPPAGALAAAPPALPPVSSPAGRRGAAAGAAQPVPADALVPASPLADSPARAPQQWTQLSPGGPGSEPRAPRPQWTQPSPAIDTALLTATPPSQPGPPHVLVVETPPHSRSH